MGDLVTLIIYFIFTIGIGKGRDVKSLLPLPFLSVCLSARGNSGTDESIFMGFMPNIVEFKYLIQNLMITTKRNFI